MRENHAGESCAEIMRMSGRIDAYMRVSMRNPMIATVIDIDDK